MDGERTAETFFAGHPFALAVHDRVIDIVQDFAPVDIRVSKSQVALRLRRGFAYLWLPGQYLSHPDAEVVLSIALGRHDDSPGGRRSRTLPRSTGSITWRSGTSPTSTTRSPAGFVRQPSARRESQPPSTGALGAVPAQRHTTCAVCR